MNNSEKIIEELKKVSLNQEEKNAIRGSIADFASSNFINVNSKINMENNFGNRVPTSSIFGWSFAYKIAVPALLLLVVVGGGTSILAEKSLPGDTLYPIKLNVNEKMETVLALNEKDSALVDLNQAVRRLTEAETLAQSGNLTTEQDNEIKANFSKEVESFNAQVAKMEVKGDKKTADEVKTKFKKEMDDHERILVGYSMKASTTLGVLDVLRIARGDDDDDKDHNDGGLAIAQNATTRTNSSTTLRKSESSDSREDSDDDEDENEGDDDASIATFSTGVNTTATVAPASTTLQSYTLTQVSTHNSTSSCYTIVSGYVYDLTNWIKKHPGGESAIISLCGIDGTVSFNEQHGGQYNPTQTLEAYKIGVLKK